LNGRTPLAIPGIGMEYSRAPKEGQAMRSLDLGPMKVAVSEISMKKKRYIKSREIETLRKKF
jgi:hypothetical protein